MTKFQQLVILGLLREKPLHGYQLDQKIKGLTITLGPMATSTLYSQMKALERAGAIQRRDVPQDDKPDKKLYTLSAEGITYFETIIRQVWTEATTDQAGACLSFLRYLPAEQIHNFLVMRMAMLQHMLSVQDTLANLGPFTQDFQSLMVAPWERRVALAAAELQWVRDFYAEFFGHPAPEFELDQPIDEVIKDFRAGQVEEDAEPTPDSVESPPATDVSVPQSG
ncbi:MAG: PadR family transcriptional regulator [Promethearchaeota archaeon CR_4]|nr:MAG: PadR family transcriptional regulator [Candidatus Lokiarchaeota archaeon CR_4]